MIRQFYLPKQITKNDIDIYDLLALNWNNFKFKRGIKKYILTSEDIEKFYNVVNSEYGTLFNEDLIYMINGISDPTDLKSGQEIILPNIQDINDFLELELNVLS